MAWGGRRQPSKGALEDAPHPQPSLSLVAFECLPFHSTKSSSLLKNRWSGLVHDGPFSVIFFLERTTFVVFPSVDMVGEVEKPWGRVQGRARSGLEEGGGFPVLLVRQPCLSGASSLPYTLTLATQEVWAAVLPLTPPFLFPIIYQFPSHFTTMITVQLVPWVQPFILCDQHRDPWETLSD